MNAPFVTVIIPALNEESGIGRCLQALERQTYPRGCYEIVVVDNGSADRTREVVLQTSAKLLVEQRPSAYHARNHGIVNTAGDYLAFTDADCIAEATWIEALVRAARCEEAMIAGGLILYDLLKETMGNRLLWESRRPEMLCEQIAKRHAVAAGNLFVRRDAFERYGLFNPIRSGSDIEFSKRLARGGDRAIFVGDAIVRHQCDLSNRQYLRRTYGEKYGQALHESRSGVTFWRALAAVPWRPGIRPLLAALKSPRSKSFAEATAEWAYRWLNRWCAYIGRVQGRVAAMYCSLPQPPGVAIQRSALTDSNQFARSPEPLP